MLQVRGSLEEVKSKVLPVGAGPGGGWVCLDGLIVVNKPKG